MGVGMPAAIGASAAARAGEIDRAGQESKVANGPGALAEIGL
jgi:hypothetical protein